LILRAKSNVFTMKNFIVFLVATLGVLLLLSCKKDGLTGKAYQGNFYTYERLTLEFESNSRVVGHISSTDFVGNFSDVVYGHYDYKHPYLNIVWDGIGSSNEKYKEVISNPDSLKVNEALDMLWLYEKGEKYTLPEFSLYKIDKNDPITKQIGDFFSQSITLAIVFIFKNIIPIAIILLFAFVLMVLRSLNKL